MHQAFSDLSLNEPVALCLTSCNFGLPSVLLLVVAENDTGPQCVLFNESKLITLRHELEHLWF